MEQFHIIRKRNSIDMPYWFAKKGQAYTVPISKMIKVNDRNYHVYKYYQNGKTNLVLVTEKDFYINFHYHEALFFNLSPKEAFEIGESLRLIIDEYFIRNSNSRRVM